MAPRAGQERVTTQDLTRVSFPPHSSSVTGGGDTIAAIATAWGEAGIAIVRVSGPDAVEVARGVLRFSPSGFPPPRVMRLAILTDSKGEPIDRVLIVWFAAPKSYTGEDVVEIHSHGGTLVAQTCLDILLRRGARAAEPGEFTRRAFLNGRMDLSQAEAVLGIIQARSAGALRAAARALNGGLSEVIKRIRSELLTLQGNIEVGLDFPEGETGVVDEAAYVYKLVSLKSELEELERRCSAGLLLREGLSVVIAGRPNVGKSSLLNALLGRDRAIVTDIPGTTRDIIEETITLSGIPLRMADTAGMRQSGDPVETMGMERAAEAVKSADICLWLIDGSHNLSNDDADYLRTLDSARSVVVLNKSDLPRAIAEADIRTALSNEKISVISVSARTGGGLDELKDIIVSIAAGAAGDRLDDGLNVTARQLAEVGSCLGSVESALSACGDGAGQDVIAGEIGQARLSLEKLLGIDCGDALLDSIFGRFCVGK